MDQGRLDRHRNAVPLRRDHALRPNGKSVEVAFCADSGKFHGGEIKTNRVPKTEPSIADYDHFKIAMTKFPTGTDLWQASKVFVETKAETCR